METLTIEYIRHFRVEEDQFRKLRNAEGFSRLWVVNLGRGQNHVSPAIRHSNDSILFFFFSYFDEADAPNVTVVVNVLERLQQQVGLSGLAII